MGKSIKKLAQKMIDERVAALNEAINLIHSKQLKVTVQVQPEVFLQPAVVLVEVIERHTTLEGLPDYKHTPPTPEPHKIDNGSSRSQPWPIERDTFTGQFAEEQVTPAQKAFIENYIKKFINEGLREAILNVVKQA